MSATITDAIRREEYRQADIDLADRRKSPRDEKDVWSDEYRARFVCGLGSVPAHIQGLLVDEPCADCEQPAVSLIHEEPVYLAVCAACREAREEKVEYAEPLDERSGIAEEINAINARLI